MTIRTSYVSSESSFSGLRAGVSFLGALIAVKEGGGTAAIAIKSSLLSVELDREIYMGHRCCLDCRGRWSSSPWKFPSWNKSRAISPTSLLFIYEPCVTVSLPATSRAWFARVSESSEAGLLNPHCRIDRREIHMIHTRHYSMLLMI